MEGQNISYLVSLCPYLQRRFLFSEDTMRSESGSNSAKATTLFCFAIVYLTVGFWMISREDHVGEPEMVKDIGESSHCKEDVTSQDI